MKRLRVSFLLNCIISAVATDCARNSSPPKKKTVIGNMAPLTWVASLVEITSLQLLDALELSRLTMKTVKQNLWWAFAYNIVSLLLTPGRSHRFITM